MYLFSNTKEGRDVVAHRGMKISINSFPNLECLLEADSIEFYRAPDIVQILSSDKTDFKIGNQYLEESKILGWLESRRIFSNLVNRPIPRLLKLKCTHANNRLYGYSVTCAIEFLRGGIEDCTFIYLSEQDFMFRTTSFPAVEKSIKFLHRTLGQSAVRFRDKQDSIFGEISIAQ
jgi:hypothetical protein